METNTMKLTALYSSMVAERDQFLRRAHVCSKITIPTLIPFNTDRQQKNQVVDFPQPWQSVGAAGVNTLASKFVMTLLPSAVPFYQFVMGKKEREELLGLPEDKQAEYAAEIEAKLQKMEQEVLEDMELSTIRSQAFTLFKHLLVAGNYVLYVRDDVIKGFPLDRYVVRRDGEGNVVELIVRELVSPKALPEAWLNKLAAEDIKRTETLTKQQDLEILTVVRRTGKNAWVSWQEVWGEEVPKTRGRFTEENNPWIVLRMIAVDGEDYGRSYVEELYGDLKSCEDLSMSIVQGGMIAAQMKWLVNPAGMTDIEDLEESDNGDYVPGKADDVVALRAEKLADFQVAQQTLMAVVSRLERAFLMTSSVQRHAERVTAHEISVMSQEIEDTLGGYYSLLGQEFQVPLIRLWVGKMQRQGKLSKFPKGSIRPKIVTGTDALGRGQNLIRLNGFLQDAAAVAQLMATALGEYLRPTQLLQMLANGRGVNIEPALIDEAEVAAKRQQMIEQQQQAELAKAAAGPAAGALAQAATQPQGPA